MTQPEDRDAISELVSLAREELPERTRAYEELVRRIYPDVRRLAFGIVGNMSDADQVTQDSLVRMFHGIRSLKDVRAFRAWSATIVANAARTFLAKESREREKTRAAANEFDEGYKAAEDLPSFSFMIGGLDPLDRTIIAMKFVQDLEFNQIAEILDLGLSQTKMRYYRAIEKLRTERERLK